MMNETEDVQVQQYNHISQQFTKYIGIPLYILCLFGTVMNILTFVQRTYGRRACSLYLLVASICDFLHLNLGPLSNILQYGFDYDRSISSLIYCKLKTYFVFVFTIISATLTILASIDRYMLSSKENRRWKYSTRPVAIRSIQLTIIFWLLVSIPIALCYTRSPHPSNNEQLTCSNTYNRTVCLVVQALYTCFINGFFPPLPMMFFGLLTCRNVRHMRKRSISKSTRVQQINYQLTSMLILQSIKSSFASLPYALFNCYLLITIKIQKKSLLQAKENFANQIFYFLFWSNYTSFFVYLYSSDIFRDRWIKAMKTMVCCLYGDRQRQYYYRIELQKMRPVPDLIE